MGKARAELGSGAEGRSWKGSISTGPAAWQVSGGGIPDEDPDEFTAEKEK